MMDIAKASRKIDSPAPAAGRVVLIYSAFAALWIFASDTALLALVRDPGEWARAGMFKGLLFVAVTALLLYVLVIRLLKATGAARQALAAHYATLIEQARDIVLLIDPDGRIVEANRAAEVAYGYRHAELLGMTVDDLRAPDSLADVERQWAAAASTEGVLFEARHRHRDGRVFPVEVSSRAIEIEGKLYRQSFMRDISERKQTEAKLAETAQILGDIVESTLAGFWDWNLVKNTEYLSPTFKRMFGYEDHEMPSSPEAWQKIIFPEDLPGVLEVFDRHVKSRGQERFYNEVRYRHRNGATVWVICVGRVIEWAEDGTAVRMVGCHIDISDRKLAEQELAGRNAELERFNRVSVNRELDMIALKKRVNALSVELGRAPPFDLGAVNAAEGGATR